MSGDPLDIAARLAEPMEGWSASPYRCPAGVWTIGFGSTRDTAGKPVTASTPAITREQGHALMVRDLEGALGTVKASVRTPLSVNETAALVDFIYNVGAGNFRASTLLRKLNAGDHAGAAAEFAKWNMGGGKVLAGLVRRRAAEEKLFRTS